MLSLNATLRCGAVPLALCLGLGTGLRPGSSLPADDDDPSELEAQMEHIEDAVKHLRRSLRDPANRERSLELVVDMQAATFACKALTPAMLEDVPESARPAFVTDYRRTLVDFLDAQLELEAALLDGDEAATKAAFDRVRGLEDTGHARFTRDED